ncbi:MAG: SRPBCC family protein [Marmoricola sp.]
MRTITRTIEFDAPAQQVWDLLTETASYPRWNPFITRLEGTLEPGQRLQVRISPPGGRSMTFRPTVTQVEPGRRLTWLGRFLVPGLFDGAHSFTVEPVGNARTRLVQSETFRGALTWFSGALLENTAAGFEAMNHALRDRLSEAPVTDPLKTLKTPDDRARR